MAAHTRTRTPRISRPKKIAALVGSGVGVAGIGLAAVLLTTSISGQATILNVPGTGSGGNGGGVSNSVSVDVDANAANGTNLNCSDIKVSDDSKTLTFNPVLKKIAANGANAGSQPVQGGSCTIFLDVKNTGTVPIRVNGDQTRLTPPAGWTVTPGTDNGLDKTIAPGTTQRISSVLTATQDAVAGPVGGQLVYEDVPAAAAAG